MHTKHQLPILKTTSGLLALLFCLTTLQVSAQTEVSTTPQTTTPAAPPVVEKPTIETVATPVEMIQLKGRSIPLNLKTLAELQRLNEEKALQEKVKETLSKSSASTSSGTSSPNSNNRNSVSGQADAAKASKPKSSSSYKTNQLVGVFGPAGQMEAQVKTRNGQVITVRPGEILRGYKVVNVTPDGLMLSRLNDRNAVQFVRVGQLVN